MEDGRRVSAQVIGANIRRIRLEHGETQQQLGELLGYGATTVGSPITRAVTGCRIWRLSLQSRCITGRHWKIS